MKIPENWDFRGWATKYNTDISDGTLIHSGAFADQDGAKVPLVWNHQRNDPNNVMGHVILHSAEQGQYAYGYFNDTPNADVAREFLQHHDIEAMSIGANRLQRQGGNIYHGEIFEVSLVPKGANPGALIEEVAVHGDDGAEAIIFQDLGGIVASEDELNHADGDGSSDSIEGDSEMNEDQVQEPENEEVEGELDVEAALDSMNDEQLAAVAALINAVSPDEEDEESDEEETQVEQSGVKNMQKNVFDQNDTIEHSATQAKSRMALNGVLKAAIDNNVSSFKDFLEHSIESSDTLQHADAVTIPELTPVPFPHGMALVEQLFPQVKDLDLTPEMIYDTDANADAIIAGTAKSPFSRVRTRSIDITGDQARAYGYIKGDQKDKELFFTNNNRSTEPQTVYQRYRLDRDDVVDITDFDYVAYIARGARIRFMEEVARAILVGDGRAKLNADDTPNKYKIQEDKIRPIFSDDDFFVMKQTLADFSQASLDELALKMADLKGSGTPSLIINPKDFAVLRLSKDAMGGYVFGGQTPSDSAVLAVLGVSGVIKTSMMPRGKMIIGNLRDYQVGSTKGGEITNFQDFDMDFNQFKALTETRLSGAPTKFRSFIALTVTDTNTIPTRVASVNVVNTIEAPVNTKEVPAN